jgi:beta-glucosidase
MKHYLAYGMSQTGRDRTPADVSEREVREYALPPFRAAVRAGARAVMVNSGEIDGEPVHASRHWLTDVLRGELGFDGVIVTDWHDVNFLHTNHRVAPTIRDAVRMAVDAGIDMSMTPYDFEFADTLAALVNDGVIPMSRIDESVRRILTLKADIGLLDGPYPDTARSGTEDGMRAADREVARRAAREAITLLKNDHVLPLARDARILVTGPAAASLAAHYGGWSYTWQGNDDTKYPLDARTLLEALRQRAPQTSYVPIASFSALSARERAVSIAAARLASVAVVALGEDAYAEWIGDLGDLTLPPAQLELANAIAETGTPTVLVLLEGRPRIITAVAERAKAIVLGYWPGMEGADALADVLFGYVNPSGRLPFTYPRFPNALATYDHRYTETLNTDFERRSGGFNPLFQFGHGLSYTTFAYRDLLVDRSTVDACDTLRVCVTVTNTGTRLGDESVLLYTRQHYASLTPPGRRLRAFERISLEPGASKTVEFALAVADLGFVGRDLRQRVEPARFDVMVGDLTTGFEIAKP